MRLGGWPAAVLVVGLAIAGLQSALILMSWNHAGANDWYWRPFALGMVGVALSYLLVGTILLRKRPGNAVAAVLAAIGLSGLIYSLVSELALWGLLVAPGSLPGAGIAGVLVPLTIDRFRGDPAIASSIFVTMTTDSMGFLVFLGLAVATGLVG